MPITKRPSSPRRGAPPVARPSANGDTPETLPIGVVGLGASAGGVGVLQQFFEAMAPDTGLVFVVVMHLSPEHESNLPEILQRTTSMPVVQVADREPVRRNHVYVIPPDAHLTIVEGALGLSERPHTPGRRIAIDLFFRTLAEAYGQRAVCVVLTGSDCDGVIGLRHIKAQGGVTIAQNPEEAPHDSMPRAAIATGMVDWVLPVREMPKKLLEFVQNEHRMQLPPEQRAGGLDEDAPGGGPIVAQETDDPADEIALRDVLAHLRTQTNHDFSHYKRATVLRRIARRLQVNSMENIPAYLKFLRAHSGEARALLQDLLISVTHFFRDREAFAALEANMPQLFSGKTAADQVRVWVPGCATGEEAYSIAMLLHEQAARMESPPQWQVFASDIDESSIGQARSGLYPSTIEADVAPERLRRFFNLEHGSYRVKTEIRERVLFAPHDILRDPPFSRLDLVSCRNLLIYLKRATQARVLEIFHFALQPGALLFIGGSESVEESPTLFAPIEKHHRLFVRRNAPRSNWVIPPVPLAQGLRPLCDLPPPAIPRPVGSRDGTAAKAPERRAQLFGELHLKLLEKYGPPSIVINERHDVVHLSEHAGRYLQFGGGEPTANLFSLVHPSLRIELRTAIFRARQDGRRISVPDLAVEVNGQTELLEVHVQPADERDASGFILVVFERKDGPVSEARAASTDEPLARHLEMELAQVKAQLSTTVEQSEASNEELKASNEELQAVNEEVRSSAEELETSKEELQSLNEELSTVNQELKNTVERLSGANSDLQNLIASTDIGTIFLDRDLCLKLFTPPVQEVFNLLLSDIGRPLSDITHSLEYPELARDAERVLEKLTTIDREIAAGPDLWFLTRIKPYRTTADEIDGVVITFVDISERKRMEEELRENAERMRQAFEVDTVGVLFFNTDGTVTHANDAFLRMSGYDREDLAQGRVRWDAMTPPEWMELSRRAVAELEQTGRTTAYEKEYLRKDGTRWWGLFTASRLPDGRGIKYVIDITARQEAFRALSASEARFGQFAENSADVLWIVNPETGKLDYVSPVYEQIWGESREEILRDLDHWRELVHPDDRARVAGQLPRLLAGETLTQEYRIIRPSDGELRWIRDTGFPIRDETGAIARIAGVARDITAEKEHLERLATSEERYRLLVDGARDYAIFTIDPSNQITYWSAGAERVFGWSSDEAVGQCGELIFTAEDRAIEREKTEIETARREGACDDRRWHLRKDGSRIWVDGVMRRLDDDQGHLRAFAKIARDATQEQLAAEKLQKSRDELELRVVERTAELSATNRALEQEIRQRSELEQEILLISEREKRRIGQDLHDSLCQELAATAFLLESQAQRLGKTNRNQARAFSEAAKKVNDNVGLARDLARGMHPVELTSGGLANALRELAYRTNTPKISCRFVCPRSVRVGDEAVALSLYRIAQEALTNALKHGLPTTITITLECGRKRLLVRIHDDGDGFGLNDPTNGLGIHIMKYRAQSVGGTLEVKSTKGDGTIISCTVPVATCNPAAKKEG